MADQLNFELALEFAESLTTIDHPRSKAAIRATAEDLVYWCVGAFLDGVPWSAEDQASWLVTEARHTWERWTSTADLRKLFRAKFPVKTKPEPEALLPSVEDYVKRKLLAPRCPLCESEAPYCEYGGHKAHAWFQAWDGQPVPNAEPKQPAPKMSFEEMSKRFGDTQAANEAALAKAKLTLNNPDATREEKELAGQIVLLYSPSGARSSKKVKQEQDKLKEIFEDWGIN